VTRFTAAVVATLGLSLASAGSIVAEPAPGAPPADPKVAWLRDNAVVVRSSSQDGDDFSDLQPLRQILGAARVLVLGEATHGDGSTFLAKTRLMRFLHRELGYDVLAFESGFYDCWKAWQRIRAGEDPDAAFRQSVFPIWTASAQVQPLIAHFAAAARSPRPLALAGIDPQFTGELSQRFFLEDLAATAEAAGMPREPLVGRLTGTLTNLLESRYESGELPEPAARSALLESL
jgi:erythromycin esterase-like protein